MRKSSFTTFLFLALIFCFKNGFGQSTNDREKAYSIYGYSMPIFHSDISPETVIAILESETFDSYYTKRHIPKSLKDTLKNWGWGKWKIANAGKPYQVTDVSMGFRRLPMSQIVLIGKSEKHFFMVYNQGGWGKSIKIIFCDLGARNLWKAYLRVWEGPQTTESVISLLKLGKFDVTEFI